MPWGGFFPTHVKTSAFVDRFMAHNRLEAGTQTPLLTSTPTEKRAKLQNLLHRFGKNQVTGRLELGEDSTLIEAPQKAAAVSPHHTPDSPVYLDQEIIGDQIVRHRPIYIKPVESTMATLMLGLPTLPKFGDDPEQSWDQWVTDFERACRGYSMDEARMLSIICMY